MAVEKNTIVARTALASRAVPSAPGTLVQSSVRSAPTGLGLIESPHHRQRIGDIGLHGDQRRVDRPGSRQRGGRDVDGRDRALAADRFPGRRDRQQPAVARAEHQHPVPGLGEIAHMEAAG